MSQSGAEAVAGPNGGEPGVAAWRLAAWPVAVVTFFVGGWLVTSLAGRTSVTGGVLLLMVSLAATAVAIGGHAYGPRVEGPLDLSTRMAIGTLGGALGGLAAAAALWLLALVHLTDLLGVALGAHLGVSGWFGRALGGAAWGFLLGIAYRIIPGGGPFGRGVVFSVLPSLYMLLVTYPDLGLGVFGVRLGALTFAFVLFLNLVWGLVVGRSLAWAEGTNVGPVSRLLGEA